MQRDEGKGVREEGPDGEDGSWSEISCGWCPWMMENLDKEWLGQEGGRPAGAVL